MERPEDENPDISKFESRLDHNWNERKRLSETEFDLRSEIQSLLQRGASPDELQQARDRENACRSSLTRNNSDYDALIEGWAAELTRTHLAKLPG
jgi:hypothetical protein